MPFDAPTTMPAPRWSADREVSRIRPAAEPESTMSGDLLVTLERLVSQPPYAGGADVVVHTTAKSGMVHVCRGSIAWVVAGDGEERLSAVLIRRGRVSFGVLRQTYRRCRSDGTNFAEALVDQGIVDRATVRAALLEHNARQLQLLLNAEPATVEVVPRRRDYASELVFSIDELIEEMRRLAHSGLSTPRTSPDGDEAAPVKSNHQEREYDMANIQQSLDEVLKIDGALAAALVDWESGLTLGTVGGGIDIELAASGNTSVVKAKMAVMRQLGIGGAIEDILITLQSQYHLIRPLAKTPSLFLYLAIDKQRGNLGLARHKLRQIEEALVL